MTVLLANFRTVQKISGPNQGPEREAVSLYLPQEDTMTDNSSFITPTAAGRSRLQRLNIQRSRIVASIAALPRLVGAALKMAYVDPYTSRGRRPQVVPDDDLEGRDPTW